MYKQMRWAVLITMSVISVSNAQGYGPHIKVWANDELFLETSLRDNEDVSKKQLGNYLARLAFKSTTKLPIKADAKDADQARATAKFELHLFSQRNVKERKPAPLLKIAFGELRLSRSKSDPDLWYLTKEGIEFIENNMTIIVTPD